MNIFVLASHDHCSRCKIPFSKTCQSLTRDFRFNYKGTFYRASQNKILIEIEIEPLNTISILILSIFQVKQYQPFFLSCYGTLYWYRWRGLSEKILDSFHQLRIWSWYDWLLEPLSYIGLYLEPSEHGLHHKIKLLHS